MVSRRTEHAASPLGEGRGEGGHAPRLVGASLVGTLDASTLLLCALWLKSLPGERRTVRRYCVGSGSQPSAPMVVVPPWPGYTCVAAGSSAKRVRLSCSAPGSPPGRS